MSTTITDCGTKTLVKYIVRDGRALKKLNGKFYKLNENDDDLKLLEAKFDKNLIGKTIYVRSAATCALGDCVCPTCVGYTASTNFDIADGLSAFESEEITKVINQNVLSAKHLLTTDSEVITFNSEFDKFFTLMGGEINPIVNNNEAVPDIEEYAIYINPETISHVDEMDDDSMYNSFIQDGKFYVCKLDDKNNKIEIKNIEEKEIYLSEDFIYLINKYNNYVPFKELNDDTKIMELQILNKELTKPLFDLMNLLDKNSERGDEDVDDTIDSLSQKLLDLLIEANIGANVIAAELIVNRLIRSRANPYERPDFTRKDIGEYDIYTVSKALEKNKSPLVGLSFQNIKRQLLSDDLYTVKDGTSYLDPFFKKTIKTDNYKKYFNIMHNIDV